MLTFDELTARTWTLEQELRRLRRKPHEADLDNGIVAVCLQRALVEHGNVLHGFASSS